MRWNICIYFVSAILTLAAVPAIAQTAPAPAAAPAAEASKADTPRAGEPMSEAGKSDAAKTEPTKPDVPTSPVADAPTPDKPTPDKPWVSLAPLPEPSAGLAGATVNGKLYLFGGLAGNRPKNSSFEFDATTGQWSKKKPMPAGLHRCAVVAYGDRIYLFGGFKYPDSGAAAWQPVDAAWKYDPSSDEWSPLAAMPSKRGAASAAVVDGKIYVIGGAGIVPDTVDTAIQAKRRHAVLGNVEEYDPKTDTWRARSALPTPRNHAAVGAIGGKIYVIGGRIASAFGEDGSDTDVVEAYDPARDLWSRPLERMPNPRSAAGAAMWRNRVVIAGGEQSSAKGVAIAAAIDSYDPGKNQWSPLPPLPEPRRGSAVGLIGDRLYVAGGAEAPAGTISGDTKPTDSKPAEPKLSAETRALQLDILK